MQIITPSDVGKNQHFEVTSVPPDLRANLEKLVNDPQQHIAWTSDVSQYVPFKPTGTHIFKPGEILHTAIWPGTAAVGYTAGLVTTEPVDPSSQVPGLIHELANLPVDMCDCQVIVTSCSLYEKLFATKRASIREITEESEKLASQLLGMAESLFPPTALPYLKFICAIADTGRKVSEAMRKANNTRTAISGGEPTSPTPATDNGLTENIGVI